MAVADDYMARLERLGVHPDEKERGSSESGPGKNITAVSLNLAPAGELFHIHPSRHMHSHRRRISLISFAERAHTPENPYVQMGWNFDASRSPRSARSKSRILDQKSELQSPEPVPQSRPLILIWQVPLLLPPALAA
ncbi:hypothetical protein AcV7_006200 [Taiwanofungus camphoratus]|nr:hypothetical protein AcV7_006200 [Antrodia cinnamomea]